MRPVTQKPTRAEIEERKLQAKREKAEARRDASRGGSRSPRQKLAIETEAAVIEAKKRDGYHCQFPGCHRSKIGVYEMRGCHGFTGRRSAFNDPTDPAGIITFCIEHDMAFDANKSNKSRVEWLIIEAKNRESIFGVGVMQMYKLARWMAERCGIDLP